MTVNLAYDQPAPTIPPGLTEHSRKMERRLYRVTDNYYLAYGFGLGSTHMIVGEDGVIIIDPLECVVKGRQINREFRAITRLPVKAVIYTHSHIDHLLGVKAFVSKEEVASGQCQVIAHETMLANLLFSGAAGLGNIGMARSWYSFGNYLPRGPEGAVNDGIGPELSIKEVSLIPPTLTVQDSLELEVAGVRMHIVWVPSETDDEIAVWFPQAKVLCSAEVVQGECFPNLHTIRGTRYRDPRQWYKSLDRLRRFQAHHLAPSHGRPVSGQAEVSELLTAYRDAIQYVHNQTIRYMNLGYTPDELVQLVKLPPALAEHPWLGEYYGTVKHAVRQIYNGELGWFNGDPTTLDPIPERRAAARYVELMGGRDKVVAEAARVFENQDYQWAAELASQVIMADSEDMEARQLKARALRQLGYRATSTNWRNWYLTSALELEGADLRPGEGLDRTDMVRAMPNGAKVEALGLHVNPAAAEGVHMTVGFLFSDTGESCALELRHCVAEFHQPCPENAAVVLSMDSTVFARIILRKLTFPQALQNREIQVQGELAELARFFSCFDAGPEAPQVYLTIPSKRPLPPKG